MLIEVPDEISDYANAALELWKTVSDLDAAALGGALTSVIFRDTLKTSRKYYAIPGDRPITGHRIRQLSYDGVTWKTGKITSELIVEEGKTPLCDILLDSGKSKRIAVSKLQLNGRSRLEAALLAVGRPDIVRYYCLVALPKDCPDSIINAFADCVFDIGGRS